MDSPIRFDDHITDGRESNASTKWDFFGRVLPRAEIVFFVQVIMVYVVVIVSIVNLTIGRTDEKLWIALLSSGIGYILPNPSLRPNIKI